MTMGGLDRISAIKAERKSTMLKIDFQITSDMVLMYMRDELDEVSAHIIETAIESDTLPRAVKSKICGSFKAAAQGQASTYLPGGNCKI